MAFAVNCSINKYISVPSCRLIMLQKCRFSTGTLRIPSYHRLLAHTRTFHLRQHNANFCQAQVLARSVLYGDASCHGKVISRNHLVPSVHLVQQKCLLSLSAAVSATSAADLELDMTLNAPLDSTTAVIDMASAASSAVEPTLQSLGLASSFPGGMVQAGLESLHIGLEVPWWTAIVLGTVFVRFCMFPLVILSQRNAAHMQNHMPTMQRLQQRMSAARRAGDLQGSISAGNELTDYMQRNNVNPLKNLMVPLAQLPIFISVYSGIREMAQLPVVSMKSGGLLWITDLTVPDPYFAFPLATVATLLVTIEVGTDSVSAAHMDKTMRYMMRAMPVMILPFIAKFPAAMLCYWLTSNVFSLVQVLVLRIPAVRQFCKIAPLVDHKSSTHIQELNVPKQSFMEGFRETMDNMRLAREMEERQRYSSLQMKKSTKQTVTSPTQSDSVTEKAKKSQQL